MSNRVKTHRKAFKRRNRRSILFAKLQDKADDGRRDEQRGEGIDLGVQNARDVVHGRADVTENHSPDEQWRELSWVGVAGVFSGGAWHARQGERVLAERLGKDLTLLGAAQHDEFTALLQRGGRQRVGLNMSVVLNADDV